MNPKSRPPLSVSTAVAIALVASWVAVRLLLFRESIFPLTYIIAMFACVWTRRAWQLWSMAATFAAAAIIKSYWLMPETSLSGWEQSTLLTATLANITIGAIVIQAIMLLRERLEQRNARISAQNHELEAQGEELAQQNEEIRAQSEELAQQNEEIESQTEELERQNQELQESNDRLGSREDMLQSVLQLSRASGGARQALDEVCRRALEIIGPPAEALLILETEDDESLRLRAHARVEAQPPPRQCWPLADSMARVVLREDRTAYVDDLHQRVDLAAPFARDGSVRSLLATPLRIAGEQRGVILACARNVTHWTREQFRLIEWVAAQCGLIMEGLHWQEKLESRAAEVEAANKAKDQFLAMLSHELRTPLTPVLAAAGALETDPRLPEDVREDLSVIRRNVAVQSRLIDDLLDLTRLGRGKIELHRQIWNIATLLREAASIVSTDLDAREQTLTMQLDLPGGCAVNGDGPRLQQVFWNLLKNAIKFSPSKGRIELSARMTTDPAMRVEIAVTDSGIGIEQDDLSRIFLPFEQARLARHRQNGEGLGLGLCIAKAIVELHGGEIDVTSPGVGQGATFTVRLPVSIVDALESRPRPLGEPQVGGTGAAVPVSNRDSAMRILLVEDHEESGRVLARLLKNRGYQVQHARDVATAIRLVEAGAFDLVVSDLGLPDGSGLDLMKQIRSSRPELNGICLSGYGMQDDVRASLDAGFREHLTKPVDVQQLHAAIARVAQGGTHVQRPAPLDV